TSIGLGKLDCDTLGVAENAEQLSFAISSTEIVLASLAYFTVKEGEVFSDGKARKMWIGNVLDATGEVSAPSSTISMTWTDDCTVEDFLLKMVTFHADGPTTVIKSKPCPAGSNNDLCIVKVKLSEEAAEHAREEGENNPDLADKDKDISMLKKYLSASEEKKEEFHKMGLRRHSKNRYVMPSSRKLEAGTQARIDVVLLYTSSAYSGSTASQLETEITTAYGGTNTAFANSNVDLEINVVRVAETSYSEASKTSSDILTDLTNGLVNDAHSLRDECSADLVQLITQLSASCGRGYVLNPVTSGHLNFGTSVVDVDCLDNLSHTHEIGHNLGCYHDFTNSGAQTHPYAYGFRYCDDSNNIRTVMSYNSGCGSGATRINYFSNPGVSWTDGRVLGSSTANNAQQIRDSMVSTS
ncbi:unnamed protein product, partial [Choristocarpus tenellus]